MLPAGHNFRRVPAYFPVFVSLPELPRGACRCGHTTSRRGRQRAGRSGSRRAWPWRAARRRRPAPVHAASAPASSASTGPSQPTALAASGTPSGAVHGDRGHRRADGHADGGGQRAAGPGPPGSRRARPGPRRRRCRPRPAGCRGHAGAGADRREGHAGAEPDRHVRVRLAGPGRAGRDRGGPVAHEDGGAHAGSVADQGQRDADGEPLASPVAGPGEDGRGRRCHPRTFWITIRIDSPAYVLRSWYGLLCDGRTASTTGGR